MRRRPQPDRVQVKGCGNRRGEMKGKGMDEQDNRNEDRETYSSSDDMKGSEVSEPDKGSDAGATYPSDDCEIRLIVPAPTGYAAPRCLVGRGPRPCLRRCSQDSR